MEERLAKFGIAILFLRFEVIYKRKALTSTAFEGKGIFAPFCMQFFCESHYTYSRVRNLSGSDFKNTNSRPKFSA